MSSNPKLCVVKKEEEEEKEDNSGTGYKEGQYPCVLYNRAVLRHKTNKEITLLVRQLKDLGTFSVRR